MKSFEFSQGNLPILVSMPHNGTAIPDEIAASMHPYAREVIDTDWYMDRIYQFAASIGCSLIKPLYSRYVIDLNRSEDDLSLYPGADVTELCPTTQFDRRPLYLEGEAPDAENIKHRVEKYWRPYHNQLQRALSAIYESHGYALLFEAHSIKSVVPRFFEGQLPDFNFGTNSGESCGEALAEAIAHWQPSGYSKVVNGRFKGGYITRQYGQPINGVDAVQLELSQATYMDEDNLAYNAAKAEQVIGEITQLFNQLVRVSKSQSKH